MKKIFLLPRLRCCCWLDVNRKGCPKPNAATCAPDAFQAALNEMRSEANREAFTEECRAFQKAKQMRQWEFKPSPKDDY